MEQKDHWYRRKTDQDLNVRLREGRDNGTRCIDRENLERSNTQVTVRKKVYLS